MNLDYLREIRKQKMFRTVNISNSLKLRLFLVAMTKQTPYAALKR